VGALWGRAEGGGARAEPAAGPAAPVQS